MAYRLIVSCTSCAFRGHIPSDAALLTISPTGETARQSFICPRCKQSQVKTADAEEIEALERCEVPTRYIPLPGPAFTEDDVIDLMLELESGSWR